MNTGETQPNIDRNGLKPGQLPEGYWVKFTSARNKKIAEHHRAKKRHDQFATKANQKTQVVLEAHRLSARISDGLPAPEVKVRFKKGEGRQKIGTIIGLETQLTGSIRPLLNNSVILIEKSADIGDEPTIIPAGSIKEITPIIRETKTVEESPQTALPKDVITSSQKAA